MKKDAVMMILGGGKPKSGSEDEDEDLFGEESEEELPEPSEVELAAADELIDALRTKDAASVVEAFKALRDACCLDAEDDE